MRHLLYSSILLIILFTSCNSSTNKCDQIEELTVHINARDLTNDLIQITNEKEAIEFIHKNEFLSNYFFNSTNQLNDTAIAAQMVDIFTHPSYKDTLYQQVKNTFGDFSDLDHQFSAAFSNYKEFYPEITIPTVSYMLSGLQSDLYVSDTTISVAADYFLGPDARYVPLGLPQYILRRYQKENIVPMSILLLTQRHNETNPENSTLLADMIYYGKSYYLAENLMPCTPDSILIGYTAQEMTDIAKNEHIIWANFLENDLLYETSYFIKNKFTGERPKTFEISNNCPGRIGLWVGWQIVRKYMQNNPEVSIQQLMRETDVNKIFSQSKYKPHS